MDEYGIENEVRELVVADVMDVDDPRSLYNICPKWVRDNLDSVDAKVLLMGEEKLRKYSDSRLNRLRMAFWEEYEEAQAMVRAVDFYQVTRKTGVSTSFARQLITESQYTLAFFLTQPVEYKAFLQESLQTGLTRLREMLDLPMTMLDKHGEKVADHKSMELILKATAFVDLRLNGGIVQKQVNVNQNMNTNYNETHVFSSKGDQSRSAKLIAGHGSNSQLDNLNAKIKELEEKKLLKDARMEVGDQVSPAIEDTRGPISPERKRNRARKKMAGTAVLEGEVVE